MLFLFFPLGVAGMLIVGNLTERLMRLAWFVPLFLLYSSYYWQAGGPPFLRFFICTFPLIIGTSFMLLEQIKIEPLIYLHLLLIVVMSLIFFKLQTQCSLKLMLIKE